MTEIGLRRRGLIKPIDLSQGIQVNLAFERLIEGKRYRDGCITVGVYTKIKLVAPSFGTTYHWNILEQRTCACASGV